MGRYRARVEFGLEPGERRLEFVGRVGAETAGLMETGFEPVEHGVEDGDEPLEFTVVSGGGDALAEIGGGDALGRGGEGGDRLKGPVGKPPSGGADEQQDHGQNRQVTVAKPHQVQVELVEIGRDDEDGVGVARDGDAPGTPVGRDRGRGGLADGQPGIFGRDSGAARRGRGAIKTEAAFVGGGHGERLRVEAAGPAVGAKFDAVVVLDPEHIGRRAVAAGHEAEGDLQPFPMAAVVDPLEIGLGELMEFGVESVDVETGGEFPGEHSGGEEQRGGAQSHEQGEAETKRVHGGFAAGRVR